MVGDDFIQWRPPIGDETTLGVVDFSICPHLAADGMPGNSMAEAQRWAAGISNTAYAIDDQTGITWSTVTSTSFPKGTGKNSRP
jgi:dipeptidase E